MTNRVQAPTPSIDQIIEASRASHAIAGDSEDPLAPVTAMTVPTTDPSAILIPIEDDELVYTLRMAGHTSYQIAHHMTITTKRRWETSEVDKALIRIGRDGISRTSDQRAFAAQLQLDRLDAALKALWPEVLNGNLQATDRFLKISEAHRNMLGLDAPDIRLQLTLGQQDAVDYGALTNEELQTLQELQRKAVSAAKAKTVTGRVARSSED